MDEPVEKALSKEELFQRMPLLRFEDWELVRDGDGFKWRKHGEHESDTNEL